MSGINLEIFLSSSSVDPVHPVPRLYQVPFLRIFR